MGRAVLSNFGRWVSEVSGVSLAKYLQKFDFGAGGSLRCPGLQCETFGTSGGVWDVRGGGGRQPRLQLVQVAGVEVLPHVAPGLRRGRQLGPGRHGH